MLIHSARRVGLASALIFTGTVWAVPPLADMAPESTVIIAGMRNVDSLRAKLEQAGLLDLLEEESFKDLYREGLKEFNENLAQAAEEAGFDQDHLSWPTGEVGLAVFAANSDDGMPMPGILGLADFGPHADRMQDVLDRVLERDVENGEITMEEVDVRGRTAIQVEVVADEAAMAEEDQFGGGMGGGGPIPGVDPEALFDEAFAKTWFVREDSTFLICSNRAALESALGVCDGEGGGEFTAREDYRGLGAMCGEDHDSYAMFLSRDLGRLMAAADQMGMLAMVGPLFSQLVGDISGVGFGYDVATEHAMVEGMAAVFMPHGRAGLTAMLETETDVEAPPGFAAANAVSYTRLNFDFDELPAFVAQVMQMAAMFGAPQPAPGEGPAADEIVGQFTACLGRGVQIVQSLDRPITASSFRQVAAIECTRPEQLENLVSTFGAGMGLEGRDFLGHRIYAMDPQMAGMMMPMPMNAGPTEPYAIGIGAGRLFMGTEPAVEQALRSAGDDSPLMDDDGLRRALTVLPTDTALAWGYGDWISSMEAQFVIANEQMQAMMAEIGADDPELAAELAGMNDGGARSILADLDWAALRKYFGPTAWIVNTADDGFVGRSYLLKP